VPAHLTFLVASRDGWGHAPHTTSTGLAAGSDAWSALRGGLLECIERDAFMTTWLGRRPPLARYRWDWSVLCPARDAQHNRSPQSYELYRLSAALDDVVVVLGVARGAPGQPAVAVGAAASCDAVTACRKALREAQQTFAWASLLQASGHRVVDPRDIDDLDDHVAYYLDDGRDEAFEFLEAVDVPEVDLPEQSSQDAEHDVRQIVAGLRAQDLSAFAVDVTTPDLRQCGLWVVRALVPQLYPLVIEHGLVLRGHPRIAGVAEPNPDPHPFP
jgi:ribosomal protein S12 methylthiotransferase accessory factor